VTTRPAVDIAHKFKEDDIPFKMEKGAFGMPEKNVFAAVRHAPTLLAIAEAGSISAAAAVLQTTQSSVTKALRRAEDDFAERLFDRRTKGVVPTPAGEVALAYAKLIRKHGRDALNAIDALRNFPGKVNVGAGASFLDELLPLAITRVIARSRTAQIRLVVEDVSRLLDRLRSGEIDVLFVSEVPGISSMSDIEWRPLINNEMDIVARAGHPLVMRDIVHAEGLLQYGWVLGGKNDPQQRYLESMFLAKGLALPVATVEALSRRVTLRIVQQSDLLTVMPNLRAQPHIKGIAKVNCADVSWVRIAGIALRRNSVLPPAAHKLIKEIELLCGDQKQHLAARRDPGQAAAPSVFDQH